jgi:hypothetical protein
MALDGLHGVLMLALDVVLDLLPEVLVAVGAGGVSRLVSMISSPSRFVTVT